MINPENFKQLIEGFKKGENNVSNVFREHIEICIMQWCRKNKLELGWSAGENLTIPAEKLSELVFNDLHQCLKEETLTIETYKEYKLQVLNLSQKYLSVGFKRFNELLIAANNEAWIYLSKNIKNYAAKWMFDRKVYEAIEPEELYSTSLSILFEKISNKELLFSDSCGLKSYYFKILENKFLELNRKIKNVKIAWQDIQDGYFFADSQENNEELIEIVQQKICDLSDIERQIITRFYWNSQHLQEIAKDLGITPENCRVIKHRAIRKIADLISSQ